MEVVAAEKSDRIIRYINCLRVGGFSEVGSIPVACIRPSESGLFATDYNNLVLAALLPTLPWQRPPQVYWRVV